jgi:serine/threonine protein kinase
MSFGSTSSEHENLLSGLIINFEDYEKVKRIGHGRFGVVELFENKSERKQWAVKNIMDEGELDYGRLIREVSILALLNHPCIMGIIGWSLPNEECKAVRIATEYASNGSIEDVLARIKKGDTPSFWTHENISCMIVGLVLGMKYIHTCNVIHRDLKPGNLLIDDKFRLRICDFGTAVFKECGTTTVAGTVAYMAPECFQDATPTPKIDVFAFGLILYELLVGESVFPKDASVFQMTKLHQEEIPVRPEIPSPIPRAIAGLIRSCWAPNPNLRPTFAEIYEKLEENNFVFFNDVLPKVVIDYVTEIRSQEAFT